MAGGEVVATFIQNGNQVTGTVTFSSSPCFIDGTVSGGVVSGSNFSGALNFGSEIRITIATSVSSDNNSIAGGYAVNVNSTPCSGDSGQITLVRR